jgi:hypothetical protein
MGRHQRVELPEPLGDGTDVEASGSSPNTGLNIADVAVVDLLAVVVLDLHDLVAPSKLPGIDLLVELVLSVTQAARMNRAYGKCRDSVAIPVLACSGK